LAARIRVTVADIGTVHNGDVAPSGVMLQNALRSRATRDPCEQETDINTGIAGVR